MRGDDHMTGKREIFGTDGVRGLANAGAMTPDSILQLGMAVGRVFKNGYPSSPGSDWKRHTPIRLYD